MEGTVRSASLHVRPYAGFPDSVAAVMLVKRSRLRLRVVRRLHRIYEASYNENTVYGKVRVQYVLIFYQD